MGRNGYDDIFSEYAGNLLYENARKLGEKDVRINKIDGDSEIIETRAKGWGIAINLGSFYRNIKPDETMIDAFKRMLGYINDMEIKHEIDRIIFEQYKKLIE